MKSAVKFLLFFCVPFLCAIPAVQAQDSAGTAQARAGELQTWREQCSDPNPDLRLAYIESAIASGDTSIQRICIRQALESDNADIRNLGLRAAIASTPQITFSVEMPKELAAAYERAGDDEGKLEQISRKTTDRIFHQIQNGIPVFIEKASIDKGYSVWFPLCANTRAEDEFSGKAVITGRTINWIGLIYGPGRIKCTIDVSVQTGGKLNGLLNCDDCEPFTISADLL